MISHQTSDDFAHNLKGSMLYAFTLYKDACQLRDTADNRQDTAFAAGKIAALEAILKHVTGQPREKWATAINDMRD